MSMRKPSAPRLLPSFSKTTWRSCAGISLISRRSTVSRMRTTASDAWSRPSTDRTPRICCRQPGTGLSAATSSGLRKNWSMDFSASASVARNSSTTLPMVWWSLTRRYSSSIHCSSGWGSPPAATPSSRSARRAARSAMYSWATSSSSKDACRYRTEVATSMASAADGGSPARVVASTARVSAWASGSLSGWSLRSESHTRLNWSAAGLSLRRSPPASADHVSVAAAMRLRAWARRAGSNRPKRGVS